MFCLLHEYVSANRWAILVNAMNECKLYFLSQLAECFANRDALESHRWSQVDSTFNRFALLVSLWFICVVEGFQGLNRLRYSLWLYPDRRRLFTSKDLGAADFPQLVSVVLSPFSTARQNSRGSFLWIA